MDEGGPRLLDLVRDRARLKHYSIRTEQAYVEWTRRFVAFHDGRHPRELGPGDVEAFLTHLAVAGRVAASTQNQAKSALLFVYREVLGAELPWLDGIETAKRPSRLPVVLTPEEVRAVLERTEGTSALILRLLYGTGMRILECLRLRVKDVDFARREILVRDGKGAKDRVTVLPTRVALGLREHLVRVRALHRADLAAAPARSIYPTRSRGSMRTRRATGGGSTSFLPTGGRSTRARARSGAITPASRRFSARCSRRCGTPASRSTRRRTRSGTRSRPTCWSRATTSAPSRSCSGMPT